MGQADAGAEREPTGELVLVFEKQRLHIPPNPLPLRLRIAAAPLHGGEKLVVASSPQLNSCVGVVLSPLDGDRRDSAHVVGASVVLGNGEVGVRWADKAAAVVCTIEVIERRNGQYRAAAYGVQPGEVGESIALVFDIPDAGCELVRSIGNLIVIAAQGSN